MQQLSAAEASDPQLFQKASILKQFAGLLNTHYNHGADPPTSEECIQLQRYGIPKLFAKAEVAGQSCCTVPGLKIDDNNGPVRSSSAEERTAERLAHPAGFPLESIAVVPLYLLAQLKSTFQALWEANLRAIIETLDGASAQAMRSCLRHPVAVVTLYSPLDYCNQVANNAEDVVVPLTLTLVMDWVFHGNVSSTIRVAVPGILQGAFALGEFDLLLEKVHLELDTVVLLRTMIARCKELTQKALLAGLAQMSSGKVPRQPESMADPQKTPLQRLFESEAHQQEQPQVGGNYTTLDMLSAAAEKLRESDSSRKGSSQEGAEEVTQMRTV